MFPDSNYIIFVLIIQTSKYLILYIGGRLVKFHNVRVNYTRKIFHISAFFLPQAIRDLLPYERTSVTGVWDLLVVLVSLAVLTHPIRSRLPVVGTMFAALDRPEDRPYTLLWLSTQMAGMIAVMIPVILYMQHIGFPELVYIPLLINGLGDGLAEPVGVRFGKHTYKTRALFTKRTYTRSLEGSACVLLVGFLAVAIMHASFSSPQLIVALLTIPILMTLTEAFSPHTWDTPFLFLVGGCLLAAIKEFV